MSKNGRPTEGAEAKRSPLNMRTSPELRAMIERAADLNGLSLTQEVERRLRTSFIFDENRGGGHIGALANMVCSAIQMIELRTGQRWMDDFDTFTQVRAATERLLLWESPGSRDVPAIAAAQRAAVEAEEAAEAAATDLVQFRQSHGIEERGILFGWANPVQDDPRREWGPEKHAEETALIERASALREQAREARSTFDTLFNAATARVEDQEAIGARVGDAAFLQFGPKER